MVGWTTIALVMLCFHISTYPKNYYKKPLVVIVGINHHWRTNVCAFSLLSDETVETYSWVLLTFVKCMGGKKPNYVVTDGDKLMRRAIRIVFPNLLYKLCSWHLFRHAVTNFKNKNIACGFCRCMFGLENKFNFNACGQHFWISKTFIKMVGSQRRTEIDIFGQSTNSVENLLPVDILINGAS